MITKCVKCGKDLSDGGAYFDSSLRERKEELMEKEKLDSNVVYAWCSKCYAEEVQLKENASLIGKFLVYYSNYKDIQDYTLNEILTRAFVLPSGVKCDKKISKEIRDLIAKEGLEIKVKDVTKKLQRLALLGRRESK